MLIPRSGEDFFNSYYWTRPLGLPGWLSWREFACNASVPHSIPGSGRSPGEGHGNPLQYSCLENPLVQRSLAGYSPWGCKESDTSKQLNTPQCNLSQKLLNWLFYQSVLVGDMVSSWLLLPMSWVTLLPSFILQNCIFCQSFQVIYAFISSEL